jgi:hypothetical protein
MTKARYLLPLVALAVHAAPTLAQDTESISFFVTSANPGKGGDLGGLQGADAYCTTLAATAGAGDKTWRAYLSTDEEDARDRIGEGPWFNAAGVKIADSVADLHGDNNNLTAETALNERGQLPNYIGGEQPLQHDMLTGTNEDGTASDMTCSNWTDGTDASTAMLGHADRMGRNPGVNSWNAVHPSQGCAMENLVPTGGAGLFYCFAAD